MASEDNAPGEAATEPLLPGYQFQENLHALPFPDVPPSYTPSHHVSYGQQQDNEPTLPLYQQHHAPPPYHQAPPPAYQLEFDPDRDLVATEPRHDATLPRPHGREDLDLHMTLSIVLTVLCEIMGGWLCLVCTVSAIILSDSAKRDALNGDVLSARKKAKKACCLNIAAVIAYFAAAIGVAILFAVRAMLATI
ncbi:hypothetical protein EMCRGX_G027886 [Ephydatia muelleri]|eukprot:Em0020g740a